MKMSLDVKVNGEFYPPNLAKACLKTIIGILEDDYG